MGETEEYGPSTYGDRVAEVYDDWFRLPTDTDLAVDFLASVAGKGPALELGIGTGRIALPLAQRGLEVQGIDASDAMVARLRQKPGGDRKRAFGGHRGLRRLADGGAFVMQAFVPGVTRFDRGQRVEAMDAGPNASLPRISVWERSA